MAGLAAMAGMCAAPAGAGEYPGAAPVHAVTIDSQRPAASLSAGGIDVRLYADTDRHGSADWPVPVAVIARDGRQVAELVPEAGGARYPATAAIVELTDANAAPEVVLESYSGGAHCCIEVQAAIAGAQEWRILSFGQFDGGGGIVRDADGDGLFEVVTRDNSFLYTFGCYACSAAPLQVLAVRDGRVVDLSAEERFLPLHRAHLARLEAWARDNEGFSANGILAGWVAAKIRVGEGADAWRQMLETYDRDDDWGLESCRAGGKLHECDAADIVVRSFPDVLRDFLIAGGYDF